MGRTVMPFSFVLEEERERWKGFRRALNKEDQEAFDRLFDRAKFHTYASVYMAHAWRWARYTNRNPESPLFRHLGKFRLCSGEARSRTPYPLYQKEQILP